MPALASEVFGLAHLAGNYALLSVRPCALSRSGHCELAPCPKVISIWTPGHVNPRQIGRILYPARSLNTSVVGGDLVQPWLGVRSRLTPSGASLIPADRAANLFPRWRGTAMSMRSGPTGEGVHVPGTG